MTGEQRCRLNRKRHCVRRARRLIHRQVAELLDPPSRILLFRAFPIRPIRTEEDLDEALAVADKLFCRPRPLNRQEQDYFELLAHEIERYEATAYPMPTVSPAGMLRHLMEAKDVTLSMVAQATRISISTLSAVMNGKRNLNLTHILRLAPYFGVEPGVFLEQDPPQTH